VCVPGMAEQLTPMLNAVYVSGNAPEAFRRVAIVPVPKKGDLSQLGNWRGLSLMSLLAKLYNHMLLYRLRSVLDPLLRKNQNGFRPGRRCPEHILCLRRLIEGFMVKGGGCVGVFIDFRKAFDSLRRECIPSLLAAYGVPISVMCGIMALYIDTYDIHDFTVITANVQAAAQDIPVRAVVFVTSLLHCLRHDFFTF